MEVWRASGRTPGRGNKSLSIRDVPPPEARVRFRSGFGQRFVVTVDTEEEWDWNGPFPMEGAPVSNVEHLDRFQSLCERHGMAATYFTYHAVMSDPKGCAVIRELPGRPGAEIGMHIHPWNTPPLADLMIP